MNVFMDTSFAGLATVQKMDGNLTVAGMWSISCTGSITSWNSASVLLPLLHSSMDMGSCMVEFYEHTVENESSVTLLLCKPLGT